MATVYIDGYNVIHRSERLKKLTQQSLEAARESFISALSKYSNIVADKVVLVFDGRSRANEQYDEETVEVGSLSVVYPPGARAADAYIERELQTSCIPHETVVVTADRGIGQFASGKGAVVVNPRTFFRNVESSVAELKRDLKRDQTLTIKMSDTLDEKSMAALREIAGAVGQRKPPGRRGRPAKRRKKKTGSRPNGPRQT